MEWTYARCVFALASARSESSGKPIASNTRVMPGDGYLAIRFHNTEIVRFYPDGSIAVCTFWNTKTTHERIYTYTGKWVRNQKLPTFNGRLSDTDKHYAIDDVVFYGVGGYLRFNADGKIDMASVRPIDVEIIEDPAAVRSARKHISALATQINFRAKLGMAPTVHPMRTDWWLKANIHRSLEEADYAQGPTELDLTDITPMWIAKMIDATKTIQFKEFA